MVKRIDLDIEPIAKRYLAGEPASSIAKDYNVQSNTVLANLRRNGIAVRSSKKLSSADQQIIIARYRAGESSVAIARDYSVDQTTVWNALKRNGVDTRPSGPQPRYHHDKRAFDSFTPESEYWAGFIFADGHVSPANTDGGEYRWQIVRLKLARRDRGHLVKFRDFLKADQPIRDSDLETTFGRSSMSSITISSRPLCDRLRALGKLSGRIADELLRSRHFWRGMVDGDGVVGDYKLPAIQLCGERRVIEAFAEFVRNHVPSQASVRPHSKPPSICVFALGGRYAHELIRILYSDPPAALDRKNATAQKMLSARLV